MAEPTSMQLVITSPELSMPPESMPVPETQYDAQVANREAGFAKLRAVVFVGALATAAIVGNVLDLTGGHKSKPAAAASLSSRLRSVIAGGIHDETDKTLADPNRGFNCGHTIDENQPGGTYDYSPQIDYLNSKPQLAKNLMDFQINDPNFGMGQAAWDLLASKATASPDTPASKQVTADSRMNDYAHMVQAAQLSQDHKYLNFTCSDAAGNITAVTPVSLANLKSTNHVNGPIVTQEVLDQFKGVAKNVDTFDIIGLGTVDITVTHADGTTTTQKSLIYMIATEAGGCLNPVRKIPPTNENVVTTTTPGTAPGETTTTQPNNTTTTGPNTSTTVNNTTTTGPNTSTTVNNTTTTQVQEKTDTATGPHGNVEVPADKDHGTPDVAGQGPAGQTPNTLGYTTNETPPPTTEKTVPKSNSGGSTSATTNPGHPTSTNPPVAVTAPVATTSPQNSLPGKP